MHLTAQEAVTLWRQQSGMLAQRGIIAQDVRAYISDDMKSGNPLAMDSATALLTPPSAGIPIQLTSFLDPEAVRVLFTPMTASKIFEERKVGDWTTTNYIARVIENTGEVGPYSDFGSNGRADINQNFPNFQQYLYETIVEYGDLEMDRGALTKLNVASEKQVSAATALARFANTSYFFGISGLNNYGLTNFPGMPASLTPGTKAAGNGNVWVTAAGVINGTSNEIDADIKAMIQRVINQTGGNVGVDDDFTLVIPQGVATALTATNSFGISVADLIKKNYPKLKTVLAPQTGVVSTTNPQGIVGGNLAILIADKLDGNASGFLAFSEKMRSHPAVRAVSSLHQKWTAGTFGAVIRYPVAVSSMLGV